MDGGQLPKVEFRRVVGYRAKKRGGNKMGPFICYVCADFGMRRRGCVNSFAHLIVTKCGGIAMMILNYRARLKGRPQVA